MSSRAVGWSEKLLEWEIQKKSGKQAQELARNLASILVPLSISVFLEDLENDLIFGLYFGVGESSDLSSAMQLGDSKL